MWYNKSMTDDENNVNLKLLRALSTLKQAPGKISGVTKDNEDSLAIVYLHYAQADYKAGGLADVRRKWSPFASLTTGDVL